MAQITEDYVSFETAKLLKEKGFDGICRAGYTHHGSLSDIEVKEFLTNKTCPDTYWECTAPTLQMAMKWLREGKNCPIEILWHWDSDNQCEEWYFKHHVELREQPQVEYYDKYEKACEAAIKYCLENLI